MGVDNIQKQKPLLPVWASVPLYFLMSVILMGVSAVLLSPLLNIPNSSLYFDLFRQMLSWLMTAVMVTLAAFFFLKYADRTSFQELGLDIHGRLKDIVLGLVWAVVLYIIGFSISLLSGAVNVVGFNPDGGVLFITFLMFFFASVTEEVFVRGYIQGRLMTKLNKFLALGISSVIFAILHFSNPNMGVLPMINLFLAGIMLGASYMYTRNLWFPIALHMAWNWIQGPLLGYEVSGTKMFPSMLQLSLPEENIINGGSFGFEGSILCTFVTILSSVIIVVWGEKINKKNKKSIVSTYEV